MREGSGIRIGTTVLAVIALCGASFAAGARVGQESLEGQAYRSAGGTELEFLFDGSGRDTDLEVGIITFPEGTNAPSHPHGSTEIFVVLEGQLEHVVNGESQILDPGMLGFVEPPDRVSHVTRPDAGPTRAVVIWAPAGEGRRIASNWERVR